MLFAFRLLIVVAAVVVLTAVCAPSVVCADNGQTVIKEDATPVPAGPPSEASAPEALPIVAPRPIASWALAGELEDGVETLRGFLAPLLDNGTWNEATRDDLTKLLERMGYHGAPWVNDLAGGPVRLIITLEPRLYVRHVVFHIDSTWWNVFEDTVSSSDVRPRVILRAGAEVPRDDTERTRVLTAEVVRLKSFLHNEGFFDAKVSIRQRFSGRGAIRVDIDISPGKPYTVGTVKVAGAVALKASEVARMFRHKRFCPPVVQQCFGHERFTRDRLNRDIRKLEKRFHARGYPGVRIRHNYDPRHSFNRANRTVNFRVTIRQRRQIDVQFDGNHKFRADKLRESTTLAENGSYDDVEVQSSADAIRGFYQGKGYFEAQVTWSRERFGVFERIVFNIDEGPQLKVKRVEVRGNKVISDREIESVLKTDEYKRIFIGESSGYVTSAQLEADVFRIFKLYKDRGFPGATVTVAVLRGTRVGSNVAALSAAVASAQKPRGGLSVIFKVEEPRRKVFGKTVVTFADRASFASARVAKAANLRPGETFAEPQIIRARRDIKQFYSKRGFPRAKVESTTSERGDGTIDVAFKVSESTRVRVGKVIVRGNFRTKEWVIRRELGLSSGDLLTLERRERAFSELRQSGLFSGVRLEFEGIDDPRRDTVNVIVGVDEGRDMSFIDMSGGWSTDSLLFSELRLTFDNIAGTGMRGLLGLQLGQQVQSFDAKLTLPTWMMDRALSTPFTLELSGFGRAEQTERFGRLVTVGGNLAATKRLTGGFVDNWLVGLRYTFRRRNRDVDLVRPAGSSQSVTQTPVNTTTSSAGPFAIIDRRVDAAGRPNPLLPSSGYYLETRASFAEDRFFGDARFVKLGGTGQYYTSFPRSHRFRLSNSLRYDHGIPLAGDVLLPELERYFAGGDTRIRGFEEDRLATEVVFEDAVFGVPRFTVRPAGGNIRLMHSIDLETTVWPKPFGKNFPISSAIFLDTGLITNSWNGFEVTDLRHSIGVAFVRVSLQFASLGIEWAVPLDPGPGDSPRGRIHFNLSVVGSS